MKPWKTGFSRKLHLAFATLLATTLGLAWYFYDSVTWYERDVQRIALANDVLQKYQQVANLTLAEINRIYESVATRSVPPQATLKETERTLREALADVRKGIVAEVALNASEQEIRELEALEDVEILVEEVLRTGETVSDLLAAGDATGAESQMQRLRSSGLSDLFNSLIAGPVARQKSEALAAEQKVIDLARYITQVLPVFVGVLIVLTVLVVMFFSSSLTRSIAALRQGAQALSIGDLGHRIPEVHEKEFQRLGEAFNAMARELADHRTQLHDANVSLEATIAERTRALKSSNQKLADVDAKRRKLLADISHEFRTPLTVIRGEAEIAMRGEDKGADAYKSSLKRIVEQADHTTRLVDDLLFIARVDAGEPRLKVLSVSLAETLQSVCEDFDARARQHDLRIDYSSDRKQVMVMGDQGRLRQVFAILLDNAIRYSRPGGQISVCLTTSTTEACITVRDQGIGLTGEEAAQAFERFFRGRTAEAYARGTGLGLPVAKAIVVAHQGRISLEANEGQGATATVILPYKDHLRVVA